jgi:hypothetical protein
MQTNSQHLVIYDIQLVSLLKYNKGIYDKISGNFPAKVTGLVEN